MGGAFNVRKGGVVDAWRSGYTCLFVSRQVANLTRMGTSSNGGAILLSKLLNLRLRVLKSSTRITHSTANM